MDPPRYLVFVSKANHTYRVASAAPVLAVHLLDAAQHDLARLFGEQTGDDVDKFARWPWTPGPEGVPILGDCPVWFTGTVAGRFDGGDHVGFLLDPRREGAAAEPFRPLGFQQVRDIEPGHSP
jgi:flavin reductase (DIM6/NTAB) family NADH-FMN oxidoreductase RutF